MKYDILQVNDNSSFLLDCPIQLIKSMVTKDIATDTMYLNVKYFSMAKVDVQSICVKITIKGKGAIKTNVYYVFSPTSGSGMMTNKEPYPFHIGEYFGVETTVTKVRFVDGSMWVGTSKPVLSDMPEKVAIADYEKYSEQIDKKFARVDVKYAYSENKHLWRCVCGAVNQHEKCYNCGGYKLDTKNFFDGERLEREYKWDQVKKACDEAKVDEMQVLADTALCSDIFDTAIAKSVSEDYKEVGEAIKIINCIYNEPNFLKKKQADDLLVRCHNRFEARMAKQVEYKNFIADVSRKLADEKRIKNEKAKRRNKITAVLSSSLIVFCLIFASVFYVMTNIVIPDWKYETAMTAFESEDYYRSIVLFGDLDGYGNAEEMVQESWYLQGVLYNDNGDYNEARDVFGGLGDYKESKQYMVKADIMEGNDYYSQGRYEDALRMFALVADEDGISLMQDKCYYGIAMNALSAGDKDKALEMFLNTHSYSDSDTYVVNIIKDKAVGYYEAGNYSELIKLIEFRTEDYALAYLAEVVPKFETFAKTYYDNGDYAIAKEMYLTLTNVREYLGESAGNRVVAYPVYCDARLYGGNYDEVANVFDMSYESFKVVQEVPGYMALFLEGGKWVDIGGTTGFMTVDSAGYAELSLPYTTTRSGKLTYVDGFIYIDGDKYVEMKVTSYSSVVFITGRGDKDKATYARTLG